MTNAMRNGNKYQVELRNAAFDYLRAAGVIAVVIYHGLKSEYPWILGPLSGSGWFGVELFFVISGFLVTKSYIQRNLSIKEFYLKRAWRILPAYVCILGLSLIFALILALEGTPNLHDFIHSLPLHLIFCSNYSHHQPVINLWSLALEVQFWVALPLIIAIIAKIDKYVRPFFVFLLMASVPIILRMLAIEMNPDVISMVPQTTDEYGYRIYSPTVSHLDGLLIGCFIGLYFPRIKSVRFFYNHLAWFIFTGLAIVTSLAIVSWEYRTYSPRPYWLAAFQFPSLLGIGFGLVLIGLMQQSRKRIRSLRVIEWISDRIYSPIPHTRPTFNCIQPICCRSPGSFNISTTGYIGNICDLHSDSWRSVV